MVVKWKLWLLMVLALYPLITTGVALAAPVLEPLPLAGRFALIVPVMVALMVWLVVPLLHRLFGRWLAAAAAAGAGGPPLTTTAPVSTTTTPTGLPGPPASP